MAKQKNNGIMTNKKYMIIGAVIVIAVIASRGVLLIPVGLILWAYAARQKRAKRVTPPPPAPPRNVLHYTGFTASVSAENMRVTDQERDAVAEELSRQFQVGRLDQDTFDKRLNTALSATRRYELDILLADLPAAV
jgi:hypothetical protein